MPADYANRMRRMNFQDHRRDLRDNRYVYAVVSRRVGGLSIGINLNPDKVCNFDCPYCQVDRTVPGGDRAVDVDRMGQELDHLLHLVSKGLIWQTPPFDTTAPALRRVGDISFAGDGEPTASAAFDAAVEQVVKLRAAHGLSGVQLSLLTNATLFHRAGVRKGLARFWAHGGEVWAKLDAGTEAFFQLVDGTTLPFERVLLNLAWAASVQPIVIQSMFHSWCGRAPADAEIAAWGERLRAIIDDGGQIRQVQVYTVARAPSDARVEALPLLALERIANVARSVGLDVSVHGTD
jgi:pyruvate-formate lyase-activating enzyme